MILMKSRLDVADNTGARVAQCIHVALQRVGALQAEDGGDRTLAGESGRDLTRRECQA